VLLSVELCSLTFQRHDTSMAHVISTGLFGDEEDRWRQPVLKVGCNRSKPAAIHFTVISLSSFGSASIRMSL
jgi:predicted naringenin-chalcone synthase